MISARFIVIPTPSKKLLMSSRRQQFFVAQLTRMYPFTVERTTRRTPSSVSLRECRSGRTPNHLLSLLCHTTLNCSNAEWTIILCDSITAVLLEYLSIDIGYTKTHNYSVKITFIILRSETKLYCWSFLFYQGILQENLQLLQDTDYPALTIVYNEMWFSLYLCCWSIFEWTFPSEIGRRGSVERPASSPDSDQWKQ